MSDENQSKQKEKPADAKSALTTRHIVLILGCVAIVSVATVITILLTRPTEAPPLPPPAQPMGAGVITAENVTEIQEQTRERVERGMFATHMNVGWRFPDGSSPSSNAVMGNSSANRFPFWFTVTLADTSEVVFTSGLMPVGTQISEIKLNTVLPAGDYPAIVNINMVDEEGEPVSGNMGINITLVIQS